MSITGTVTKVIRRRTPHGSAYLTVDVQAPSGHTSRLRYLQSFTTAPVKGQVVTIEGMPLMGFPRVNIGAVRVQVHQEVTP
jgi:hypothetical protein